MPRNERTGWRDIPLIEWHKARHMSCRAAGIQFLMLEFNRCQKMETCKPVAVIDYRRYEDGVPNTEHPIYRAVRNLCGEVPFYLCYHDKNWGFYISPQNLAAKRAASGLSMVSEHEFVQWLHDIRGGMPQTDIRKALGSIRPVTTPSLPMAVPQLASLDDGTLWRGQELSGRHRDWGNNVPVVDLDFLLIDNNDAVPLALVDFKFSPYARQMPTDDMPSDSWKRDANIRAQLAFSRSKIPFRVVRYVRDPWKFQIVYPVVEQEQTENEWLERLRKQRMRFLRPSEEGSRPAMSAVDHTCRVCGAIARFGFGPPGRVTDYAAYERMTVWFCRDHRPDPTLSPDAAWQEAQAKS